MTLARTWSVGAAGVVAAKSIATWMSTLQYRTLAYDPQLDPRLGCDQPRIYVFWHEYILLPLYLRPHCDLVMLLSKHKDAEVLSRVARHMGYGCIRGSTNRGGVAALRAMTRQGKQWHLTMTPDGPRGPRRQLSTGPVFLASKTGMPIVPLGFGYNRPWRMNSWDQFALPRPFSRGRTVIGPEIFIPPELTRDELESKRQGVERLLTDLTLEAEDWATSGAHRLGESCERRLTRVLNAKSNSTASAENTRLLPLPKDDRSLLKSA